MFMHWAIYIYKEEGSYNYTRMTLCNWDSLDNAPHKYLDGNRYEQTSEYISKINQKHWTRMEGCATSRHRQSVDSAGIGYLINGEHMRYVCVLMIDKSRHGSVTFYSTQNANESLTNKKVMFGNCICSKCSCTVCRIADRKSHSVDKFRVHYA